MRFLIYGGLGEWITGYYEVLAAGRQAGLEMPYWRSYQPVVDAYVAEHGLQINKG